MELHQVLNNKKTPKQKKTQHPTCRVSASVKGQERLSHPLLRYTVRYFYSPASAVIYICHICTHDYTYIG